MLIEKVRADRMTAMKARNTVAKTVLTTLLGELETAAKRDQCTEITDETVVKLCKKFVAANIEVIDLRSNVEQLTKENVVLNEFIPKQLTKRELYAIIESINADNLGAVMKYLKVNHNGTYDGKLAADVAHAVLSE